MIAPAIRDRYLRDPLPVRLGGIAADLARVVSCAANSRNHQVVASLLEEAKWFAEWAAPEAPIEIQEVLAELQSQVAWWQRRWLAGAPEPSMSTDAQAWSDRVLKLSGLV